MKLSKKSLMIDSLLVLGGCNTEDPALASQEDVEQIPFLKACACEMIVDWSNITTYKDGSIIDPRRDIDAIDILIFDLSKSEYITMANGELIREYNTLDYVTFQPVYGETSGSLDTGLYSDKIMAIRVSAEKDSMLITNIYEISSSVSEAILAL